MPTANPKLGQTPLMRQYYSIKAQHPDHLLLFRMGDFYETFDEDAQTASRILGIVLSKRANGRAQSVRLAGFPHHALDNHLPKLIQAGLRVAICEQLEDPRTVTRRVVKRGVVEVVTPGVSLHENLLSPSQANYLAAVHWDSARSTAQRVGVAYLDISTGEYVVAESSPRQLDSLLQSIAPSEILVEKRHESRLESLRYRDFVVSPQEDWVFSHDYAYDVLLRHFGTHSLEGFGVTSLKLAQVAAGAILHYVGEAQQGKLGHIKKITQRTSRRIMHLDPQTRINLGLLPSQKDAGHEGPLFQIVDKTSTAMGGRMLRSWFGAPLLRPGKIRSRLDLVEALVKDARLRTKVQDMLKTICDMERIVARVCTGRANPRQAAALGRALGELPIFKALLEDTGDKSLSGLGKRLDTCEDSARIISRALADNPPPTLREGGVFREGYSDQLDRLRSLASSGKGFVASMQERESQRTGIPSLKVGYNKVFGYYLEITNTHKDKVPDDYVRKQTLVNAERYITPELKEYESQILTAEEQLIDLERELFVDLLTRIGEEAGSMQQDAKIIAALDCFCSLAELASDHNYCRPAIDESLELTILDGRHAVVEQAVETFIPNTVRLDPGKEQIHVITGPNMAGKSVVLRQTGLIVLLAQAGSFVPASEAHIGIVDRIFTRVGASDNLVAGESTFLVEMNETASILHNATPRSLLLLDEVGRGTSTFDGLSVAWALIEHLHENPQVAARTLFATHYHELNALADKLDRVHNYRIQVQEHKGRIVFLHKLIPGGADHSYGLEVARMAGLPESVLVRARQILKELEQQPSEANVSAVPHKKPQVENVPQLTLFSALEPDPVAERVRELDPNNMTPMQALQELESLKKLTENA